MFASEVFAVIALSGSWHLVSVNRLVIHNDPRQSSPRFSDQLKAYNMADQVKQHYPFLFYP